MTSSHITQGAEPGQKTIPTDLASPTMPVSLHTNDITANMVVPKTKLLKVCDYQYRGPRDYAARMCKCVCV